MSRAPAMLCTACRRRDRGLLSRSGDHRALHSFPTRRSSELTRAVLAEFGGRAAFEEPSDPCWAMGDPSAVRSEEHTSELQSQFQLVCRLLLEKKNISYGRVARAGA